MSILDQIKLPVKTELGLFEEKFRQAMKSRVPLLDKILHYIIRHKGKQVRPMFVFLSARMFGEVNESTFRAAALIELLHTATLVHDDVVDDSYMRRGIFSINALWKNKIAVLVGDYFLSRGLLLSIDNNEYHLLKIVSEAVKQMSEGELLQIEKNRKTYLEENDYFQIIRQKTASLFASSCASGAASVVKDENIIHQMKSFGESAGMAFQMKDDLLDFELDGSTGKPGGVDLKSKTMTLPLIFTVKNLEKAERRKFLSAFSNGTGGKGQALFIPECVRKTGGIEYTKRKMNEKKDEAIKLLADLPETQAKESIIKLVEFICERPN